MKTANILTWIWLAFLALLLLIHTHEAGADPERLRWYQPHPTGDRWEFEFAAGPVWPVLIPLDWEPIEALAVLPDAVCYAGTVDPPADGYVRVRAIKGENAGEWSLPRAVPEMDFALGTLIGFGALCGLWVISLR